MALYAILDGKHQVVPVDSIDEFVAWFDANLDNRTVALDELPDGRLVSTVFLGINHDYTGRHPKWFETMVFRERKKLIEEDMERYETWNEALAGHAKMVRKYKK